jgi:hypothetical protein
MMTWLLANGAVVTPGSSGNYAMESAKNAFETNVLIQLYFENT